jgi:hypothetical protein
MGRFHTKRKQQIQGDTMTAERVDGLPSLEKQTVKMPLEAADTLPIARSMLGLERQVHG